MEEERWAQLEEFPNYQVSSFGRVLRTGAAAPMSIHTTQHGHAKLNLYDENGDRYTRSVAKLVAAAFCSRPYPDCDTVIVKNMDYMDLRAENLAWRTEGYAWKYANQFKQQPFVHYLNLRVTDTTKKVEYKNIVEAAIDNGLLFEEIWVATYTGNAAYPSMSRFVISE